MLDSTIELISMAASNSLAVFCFCNLIIAILLVGSSKPTSHFDELQPKYPPTIVVLDENFKKHTVSKALVQTEEEKVSISSVSIIDMVENEEETEDEEEHHDDNGDDGDDDELRKRFEEFIERTNRGWRAEKMKTHSLVQ